MKKFISPLIVIILIGLIIFVFSTRNKKIRSIDDKSSSSQSRTGRIKSETNENKLFDASSKLEEKTKGTSTASVDIDPQQLSDEEIAEFEEYFEEVEKNWATQIEALFVGEFSLGEDALEKYMNLREGYEEEKMIAFQEFHEFMVSKYGENYSFQPSADMESFENKVEVVYLEKMKNLLGQENFERYLEVKNEFNERIRKEQDSDKGVILIEL